LTDSNTVLEEAEAILRRVSPEARAARHRRRERQRRRFLMLAKRLVLATIAAFAALLAWGLAIGPVGTTGVMLFAIATMIAWAAIFVFSREPEARAEDLVRTDLAQLPHRTEIWLESQRPALPAPAQRLSDGIGLKLQAMAPQLVGLDAREPAAVEIRKLIGEELPELIDGYRRVPDALRRESRHGQSPDAQLVEGLNVVDQELSRMTEQLASGDLHKLATQGRFLELKYRGDESLSS
jgi:hypothetical protein